MYPGDVWLNQYLSKKCLSTRTAEWLMCANLLLQANQLFCFSNVVKKRRRERKKCPLTMENISRWTWDVVTDEKILSDITLVVVNK